VGEYFLRNAQGVNNCLTERVDATCIGGATDVIQVSGGVTFYLGGQAFLSAVCGVAKRREKLAKDVIAGTNGKH
jgi:hypothetical protein